MREYIGDVGHIAVLVGFVTALFASISYLIAHNSNDLAEQKSWKNFARIMVITHGASVFTVIFSLFNIIQNHYYEYHYAWSHSSNFLPAEFMISCFWEGQEGSFLLWIFWHVMLSFILLRTTKGMESPVMAIFFAVQTFLVSMIIGVVIFDVRIGSSPFILLKEALYTESIFQTNPNFIPEDGTGLNPLLQNYWMVIHPPTLFLGFALTLIPFAYCIAGITTKQYTEWVKPVMPWNLIGGVVLGVGILMGGYWAYETLNFGGYWNWDPVENAVYVPWLTLIASIHTLTLYKKNGTGLKFSIILLVTTFILILYSTFLTRSGILGEASVHSFTDLGLSGQLLIYLLFFVVLSVFALSRKWKNIPEKHSENNVYTNEFWIFIGMAVVCIAAFQVIFGTSIPVINKIAGLKLAPPTDQITFYGKYQIWAGIFIAGIAGFAQYFWWNGLTKANASTTTRKLVFLFLIILMASSAIITIASLSLNYYQSTYFNVNLQTSSIATLSAMVFKVSSFVLLFSCSIFSIFISTLTLIKLYKNNREKIGGAITHIGVALMLIGMLFSAAYDKVISVNFSGMVYAKEAPTDFNTENVLLWRNKPSKMVDYELIYKGPRLTSPKIDGYINKDKVLPASIDNRFVITEEKLFEGTELRFDIGDTLEIYPENTYFEVEYRSESDTFSLFPRAQKNESMGLIASPDTRHYLSHDLYSFISYYDDFSFTEETEWRSSDSLVLHEKDTTFINDYVVILDSVRMTKRIPGAPDLQKGMGVMAFFTFLGNGNTIKASPSLVITENNIPLNRPEIIEDLGLKISFDNIDPQTGTFHFKTSATQLGYIILKAVKKPWINILWIGTIILIIGFLISIYRRFTSN